MMGVLFCCGAGFFIRRRMYPSPLRDEPAFNVSFTRHPVTTPGTLVLHYAPPSSSPASSSCTPCQESLLVCEPPITMTAQ
uniref:WW domain binding protein VOPP1 n=1 Tax=Seriola lalandi dorsalis TaxID=1841481 RepID=A0A3B4X453_SERLL